MGGAQAARRAAGGRRHDGASGCERRRIGEGAGPPSRRRTLGPRGGSRPALARREDGGEGRGRGPGGSGFKLPLVSLCSVRRPRAGGAGREGSGQWGAGLGVRVCVRGAGGPRVRARADGGRGYVTVRPRGARGLRARGSAPCSREGPRAPGKAPHTGGSDPAAPGRPLSAAGAEGRPRGGDNCPPERALAGSPGEHGS